MPEIRYRTLVPKAISGVCVMFSKKPHEAIIDDEQAAISIAIRMSQCHVLCKAFLSQNPLTVAMKTSNIAIQSPPNKRQKDALANPVSMVTNVVFRRFSSSILLNFSSA